MKKLCFLLLAIVLIFAGCSEDANSDGIRVKDVCCPYEISEKDDALEVTLENGSDAVTWLVQTVPQDVCTVIEKDGKYRIAANAEGAAQVTFTAMQEDESVKFVLTLVVETDGKKVILKTHEHRERNDVSVEAEEFTYNWNVDVEGILTFSFINSDDSWSVRDDESILLEKMSTPSGCRFSVQSLAQGQSVITLVGESTNRTVYVTIEADGSGNLAVISVQEQ